MANCPTCGCDLPGTEELCRDCFEKRYAALSAPTTPTTVWQRLHPWLVPLLMVAIFAPMFLANDWFSRYIEPPLYAANRVLVALGVAIATAQWVLFAAAVGGGIWESLRARSWRVFLLWLMYVPIIVGFVLWKMTGSGTWLTVTIGGSLLAWAERYNARRRGLV